MNWTWKTATLVGLLAAALCIGLAMVFTRGLGLDDFWTGISVGFLSVICFAIAVVMSRKRTVSPNARTAAHRNRN